MDMQPASPAIGTDRTSRRAWQTGRLAWALALVSIVLAIVSLVIALRGAAISGDYRAILSHQTLTPFITIGVSVLGALVASHHPRNPFGWIFVTIGLLYALTALSAALVGFYSHIFPGPRMGLLVWLLVVDSSRIFADDVCAAVISRWSLTISALAFRRLVCWPRSGADRPGGHVPSRSIGQHGPGGKLLRHPGCGVYP